MVVHVDEARGQHRSVGRSRRSLRSRRRHRRASPREIQAIRSPSDARPSRRTPARPMPSTMVAPSTIRSCTWRDGSRGSAQPLGRKTWNDAPPPARSSSQARPPCSSANRRTRDRPMPTPGECSDDEPGAWRNGSNTASRRSGGHARDRRPRRRATRRRPCRTARTQILRPGGRVADGVREQVLHDALDLRGVDRDTVTSSAIQSRSHDPLGPRSRRPLARTSAARSVGRRWGDDDAALQPVQVQQVAEQPFELAGVRRDPWTRSSASSRGSSSRVCSSVSAEPRIEVSGVRRSCETASRNVFFISSSARSRCAASRSRRNASEYFRSLLRRACSARLRSVMSTISPRS